MKISEQYILEAELVEKRKGILDVVLKRMTVNTAAINAAKERNQPLTSVDVRWAVGDTWHLNVNLVSSIQGQAETDKTIMKMTCNALAEFSFSKGR